MTASPRVALMITCLADMFYPEIGERIVRLLRHLGVTVTLPAGQTCCGLPLFNSGYHGQAAAVARRTVALFADAEAVVVPSGSCAWMVKHEYPGLLAGSPDAAAARQLAGRTWEFSQYLVRKLGRTTFATEAGGRVAYHDSCHLLRGLHEAESPRTLLRNLDGVEIVDLAGSDECCGFGGSFSVRLPEVSTAILERKLLNIEASGATCVVACDAGCLMQMKGGLGRRGSAVRALHLAELLERERAAVGDTGIEARPGSAGGPRATGDAGDRIEARPGSAGAPRATGDVGDRIEARPGSAGACRAMGGVGGHFGAPHENR